MKSFLDTRTDHKQSYFIEFDVENPQNVHKKLNLSHFFGKKNKQFNLFFKTWQGKHTSKISTYGKIGKTSTKQTKMVFTLLRFNVLHKKGK